MERRRMRRKPSFGKRMMVTMLSLVMLLSLAACGSKDPATTDPKETGAAQDKPKETKPKETKPSGQRNK